MKKVNAVIGGEGNGGVIYPELHYGRDALVGIALFLNLAAEKNVSLSELKKSYPHYEMVKDRIELSPNIDVDMLLESVKDHFRNEKINTIDGVKIDFDNGWVHLRKSNTEPIIRVYSESRNNDEARRLADDVKNIALNLIK